MAPISTPKASGSALGTSCAPRPRQELCKSPLGSLQERKKFQAQTKTGPRAPQKPKKPKNRRSTHLPGGRVGGRGGERKSPSWRIGQAHRHLGEDLSQTRSHRKRWSADFLGYRLCRRPLLCKLMTTEGRVIRRQSFGHLTFCGRKLRT